MDENKIMGLIESILFVSGEAVSVRKIADFLNMDKGKLRKIMDKLVENFNSRNGGLQIIKMNDHYQLATRPEYGEYIDKYFGIDKKQSLSQAMLETLSIIAYKQPITRIDIESIRGVKCEYTLGVLNDRGLIKEVGKMDAPGKPILYGTTDTFLKVFGLSSLEDLPPLTE
ncbi:MAG: SMC-Scp complex subunit ScpB [Caldicoprobacterales bacterium]|jgi:segregation and condensation protein B|nr:SMC-Scp complex subunit ScpB [Clostridiales bacterium]